PSASPPNFSRAARPSSQATTASATTASASTADTSLRSTSASPGSPVWRSTEASGCISVGRGFIAARTTISSPFETPPSIPPARLVVRCNPRSSRTISSWASEPRRLARARALECVPDVLEPELLRPGEIGVARPRQCHRLRPLSLRLALGRPGAHPPGPVFMIAVADDERERRPERPAMAQTRKHLDLVLFQLLARTAAVALLPAAQVGVDGAAVEDETRRQAGENRDQGRTVRLARGCQRQ